VAAAGPFGLGPLEIGLIVLVLLMLFGTSRLADLGGSLGKGIREFRKSLNEDADESQPGSEASPSIGRADVVAAVKCRRCETLNPVEARVCGQCGSGLRAESEKRSLGEWRREDST
jgi:TatA/E family protein of Tat protein translocase